MSDKVFDLIDKRARMEAFDRAYNVPATAPESTPVASWLNPEWEYLPAASHGDSAAFAARQRERAKRLAK
jgi:hypothetical protein